MSQLKKLLTTWTEIISTHPTRLNIAAWNIVNRQSIKIPERLQLKRILRRYEHLFLQLKVFTT